MKNKIDPARTAIKRKRRITPYAKQLVKKYQDILDFESVLDFGCGWSKDFEFFQENGIDAVGYDRDPKFDCFTKPDEKFDLVNMFFVINVLPSKEERLEAISEAKEFVKDDGALLIITRTGREIEKKGKEKEWPTYNDGYISRDTSKWATFQKGHSEKEIIYLAEKEGLTIHPKNDRITFKQSSSSVLFTIKG